MWAVAAGLGRRLLASRPLAALGKASYSLYLWHLPVLVACALLFTKLVGMIWSSLIGVALAALVAALSYRYIEAPVQRVVRARRLAMRAQQEEDARTG